MTYDELIKSMTPEIYQSLKLAVELSKWPDGQRLSQEQQEICLRALIAYDHGNKSEDERIGYIDRTKPDGSQHGKDPYSDESISLILGSND